MFTPTLYSTIYLAYPCLLYTLYIPLYILCTHVYPSNTVYLVYHYISCVPMFTLVILYTLVYHYISCVPMFTLVILYTLVYPYISCVPMFTLVILCTLVYPYISCVPMFTLVILYTLYTLIYLVYPCLP